MALTHRRLSPPAVTLFLVVESFVAKGPPRAFLLRLFKMERKAGSKEAKRVISQAAVRAVGCVFLTLVVRRRHLGLLPQG